MRKFKNEHEIDYTISFRNGFFHVLAINENGAVRVEGKTEQEAKRKARSELKKLSGNIKQKKINLFHNRALISIMVKAMIFSILERILNKNYLGPL